jgi:hypothetical protein
MNAVARFAGADVDASPRTAAALDARFELDELSAHEQVRRMCLRWLPDASASEQSFLIRVGEESTTVVLASGADPIAFWRVGHADVKLVCEQAGAAALAPADLARRLDAAASASLRRARLSGVRGSGCRAIAASRLTTAIVTFAANGRPVATREKIQGATEVLAEEWAVERRRDFPLAWVQTLLVGAAVLDAIARCLGVGEVAAEAGAPSRLANRVLEINHDAAAYGRALEGEGH